MAEQDDKGRVTGKAPLEPRPVLDPVAAPFPADVHDWETDLDAWDRALPIAGTGDTTEPIELEPDVFFETPVTETEAGDELAGPPSGVVPGHFEAELTPSSGSYAALVTDVHPSLNMAIPTGTFDDGTVLDATTFVTWTSSDLDVGDVSNADGSRGQATAFGAGSTTVQAQRGTITATTTLTVQ